MTILSLRLPDSLHRGVKELAAEEGISINQFVITAVAEKMAALMTEEYLGQRAARGTREGYLTALETVPDVEPDATDQLPDRG